MINNNLLFFCTMCKNKPEQDIARINCKIEHTVKEFKRGEYIVYQGDRITNLLMLTKGSVKTEIVSDSGFTLTMDEIEAPYPLASALLFADVNRFPIDIIATKKSEILVISKETIEEQIAKCPGFLRGFMAFNANRMLYLSERIKISAQKSIKAKLAYYILSKDHKGSFDLGRSIVSLAEYFGVERPSLSRAISEMGKDKIIYIEAGKGKILDYKAIHNLL